jgi:PGF-CTERM protein/PGF-pre-PGF domain-containing protein
VTVNATEEEDDEDNGNQTDDGGDDADSGDGSNGGTGGGAGGGGGNGGVSTGDSADTADQTPTIQEIKDTLGLLDQPETETPITETNPETEGQTVTPTGTQTVQTIEFGSDVGGSVTIQEYETPPLKVAKQIRESIAADVSGINDTATTESGEPSDRAGGVNVTSVVDITPTNESAQDASGTVTLRVNREAVTNPERLMVFKEEYVFEAQTEQWVQLNTTVTNTTAQHVTVRAEVSSFSLFAVTELNEEIDTGQTNETATNETATNETEPTEPTDDGIPGFGAVVAVIAVIASAAVARRVSN